MVFPVFHLPIIIIASLFVLFLGVLVFLKEKRSATNKFFLFLALSIFLWIITLYISDYPPFASQALFWNRATVGIGFLMGVFLLYLVLVFPAKRISISPFWKIFLAIGGIISILCLFTNFVVKDVEFYPWGTNIIDGKLFFLSVFWSILNMGAGIWVGVSKLKKSIGLEKTQFKFLIAGILLFFITGLTFNMILPTITGTNEYAKYGSYFTLLYIIPIAAGIIKYRLFDIKVILTEIFTVIVGLILFIQAIVAPSLPMKVLNTGIFLLFCLFGYFLVKSVIREVELRQEVEKLSQAKSEFISIASHQLRTPLTAVKGYISMILEGTYDQLAEKQVRSLENVYQSNERLIRLVNDLLNLSRLDAGKIEFSPELISLEEMVPDIIEELRINAEKKGLYIKMVKLPEPLPKIMVDQDKLRQVILNIVDNAIKYTKEGGVTFELKKLDEQEEIKVSDTGEGMDEGELSSLFQMFSRATAGTQLHAEGAGLGLYVARQFIEMHGGKIWAESPGKGKGSAFIIQLPIKLDLKLMKEKTKIITKAPDDIF